MYHSKMESPELDELFDAILSLENREDCYRLFDDLCTIKEIQSLSQRFQVAKMLDSGVTYSTISESINTSTATISRVNRCLLYGADGYRRVLDRMAAKAGGEDGCSK